jgi:hypothetical protein
MPGLRADTASYPMPSRSTTPGRKLSTTTSAVAGQGKKASRPAVVLQVDHDPAHAAVTAVGEELRIDRRRIRRGHRTDLDDERAVVGQQARATRGWPDRRKVEDGDPFQGSGGRPA